MASSATPSLRSSPSGRPVTTPAPSGFVGRVSGGSRVAELCLHRRVIGSAIAHRSLPGRTREPVSSQPRWPKQWQRSRPARAVRHAVGVVAVRLEDEPAGRPRSVIPPGPMRARCGQPGAQDWSRRRHLLRPRSFGSALTYQARRDCRARLLFHQPQADRVAVQLPSAGGHGRHDHEDDVDDAERDQQKNPDDDEDQDREDDRQDRGGDLEVERLDGVVADIGRLIALDQQHDERTEEAQSDVGRQEAPDVRDERPGALRCAPGRTACPTGPRVGRSSWAAAAPWSLPSRRRRGSPYRHAQGAPSPVARPCNTRPPSWRRWSIRCSGREVAPPRRGTRWRGDQPASGRAATGSSRRGLNAAKRRGRPRVGRPSPPSGQAQELSASPAGGSWPVTWRDPALGTKTDSEPESQRTVISRSSTAVTTPLRVTLPTFSDSTRTRSPTSTIVDLLWMVTKPGQPKCPPKSPALSKTCRGGNSLSILRLVTGCVAAPWGERLAGFPSGFRSVAMPGCAEERHTPAFRSGPAGTPCRRGPK